MFWRRQQEPTQDVCSPTRSSHLFWLIRCTHQLPEQDRPFTYSFIPQTGTEPLLRSRSLGETRINDWGEGTTLSLGLFPAHLGAHEIDTKTEAQRKEDPCPQEQSSRVGPMYLPLQGLSFKHQAWQEERQNQYLLNW